jgi:hypothetical protein
MNEQRTMSKSEVQAEWWPKAESRKPNAGGIRRKPEAGSRKSEVESRKPKAESRKPKAESRKPKAESRKPKAESRMDGAKGCKGAGGSEVSKRSSALKDAIFFNESHVSNIT